jgi:hypothetical protein
MSLRDRARRRFIDGRLVVEARGTASTGAGQGIAAVGNSDPLYLVVSVTDADGVPVSGLAATDFTIDTPVVAPGGSLVEIASAGGGQHGDYSLDVFPVTYHGTRSRTGQRHHPIGVITVRDQAGATVPGLPQRELPLLYIEGVG